MDLLDVNCDTREANPHLLVLKNVRPAFEVWEKLIDEMPLGYQQSMCHLIFDVKLGENFRRKARFVAGGHTTKVPIL